MRNKRIARKRSGGERPYAVIKNIFKSGHQLVTTTLRTHTKNLFTCFCYNLLQLKTLQKKKQHPLANAIQQKKGKNRRKNKENSKYTPKKKNIKSNPKTKNFQKTKQKK